MNTYKPTNYRVLESVIPSKHNFLEAAPKQSINWVQCVLEQFGNVVRRVAKRATTQCPEH